MVRHTSHIRVEWGDCDPAGIVFYPNYYRWMDTAALHLFDSVGLGWEQMRQKYDAPGLPIISSHAEFRAPSYFGDLLELESHVSEWGKRSLTVSCLIRKPEGIVVEGWEKRIWSKGDPRVLGRIVPAPIPDEVRAALGGMMAMSGE